MEQLSNSKQNIQYSLSIRFSSDGFSLSIYDELNKLLTLKTVSVLLFSLSEEEIVKLLIQETENLLNFQSIRLICESDNYSFVPATIFKEEDAGIFLQFNDKLNKNDRILFNRLPQFDMVNVFSIPKALKEALTNLYPDLIIEHHLSYFLTDKIKLQKENSLQIWVRPKFMDVIIMKNGNVILINSYTYLTSEDFVFFTLNLFEQLSLDTEKHKVKLYNLQKTSDIQRLIQKYVKYCEVID